MICAMSGAAQTLPNTIQLTAIDAARNIRRRYAIVISIDLFGAILVETHWGRIGARARSKPSPSKTVPRPIVILPRPSGAAPHRQHGQASLMSDWTANLCRNRADGPPFPHAQGLHGARPFGPFLDLFPTSAVGPPPSCSYSPQPPRPLSGLI